MKVSPNVFRKVKNFKWVISTAVPKLGHKDEPYYKTETEMLKEPEYTYESLSPSEKKIYDESRSSKQNLL